MIGLSRDGKPLAVVVDWYTWIEAGSFKATAGCFFDRLTAIMLCVVTGIGFLITVFAAGYMKGEAGYFRFFAYLGLFIFSMTCLVMGNNFIMLYLGWEGVGLCSYLLIGYYYEKPSRARGRQESVSRQPHRRFRLRPGHHADLPDLRHGQLFRHRRRDAHWRARTGHDADRSTEPDRDSAYRMGSHRDEMGSVPADARRVR